MQVKLGEYESAMTGFQQIMDQNPYSYESLTASWDYAATSLLIQGQGGGESSYKFQVTNFCLVNFFPIRNIYISVTRNS